MSDKKKRFPTQPSLVGKEIFLRPATPEDIANFHHWFIQSEPQSQTVHPMPFLTIPEASERFKKSEKNTDRESFTIVRKEDKTPIGKISFFNFNSLNLSAELGILIDPDERQRGYAKEAMMVLMKYLFSYRNLNKVYAETAAFNGSAVKLLESLNFKKDGTLRSHHFYDGEFHNKFIYSLLRFEL
jgi:ribosomal-protein-alanine N-acetyltransferase